jgi:hypothetical protein
LLARIECDMGHHQAELHCARRLMALGIRRREALEALKHAGAPPRSGGRCNGLAGLARRAGAALARLPLAPERRTIGHRRHAAPGSRAGSLVAAKP